MKEMASDTSAKVPRTIVMDDELESGVSQLSGTAAKEQKTFVGAPVTTPVC